MAVNSVREFLLFLVLYFVNAVFCVHVVPVDINLKNPFIPQLDRPPVKVTSTEKLINHENQVKSRISERKCEEYTLGTRCEFSKDDFDPNLSGTARVGQFPHMVFLGTNSSNPNWIFICGGSLISPKFVLAAAKCFIVNQYGQPINFVSLGDHNKDPAVDDGTKPLQVPIKNIHFHPNFTWSKKYNNIALVELAFDVPINNQIRPACLWTRANTAGYTRAIISTIGSSEGDKTKSRDMQKVSISIIRNKECNSTLARFIAEDWDHGEDSTEICGWESFENSTYCKSQFGAPMQIVTQNEKRCSFSIIGITSIGFEPICADYPIVLTRVSSYLDWIESLVWPEEYTVQLNNRNN